MFNNAMNENVTIVFACFKRIHFCASQTETKPPMINSRERRMNQISVFVMHEKPAMTINVVTVQNKNNNR